MTSRGSTVRSTAARSAARALAFALGALAPTAAGAQVQASPGTVAPAPPPMPPAASAECAVAAPSCFTGCRESQVRTAAGQCVPASPPATAPRADRVLAASLAPAAAPPAPAPGALAAPASAERACCHVRLEIAAVGLKNLGDHAAKTELRADVRINGQLVGQTPFADGLPSGDYRVEVIGPSREVHARLVLLRTGKHQRLDARFTLPLDAQELAARDAFRRERAERARAAEQAERERKREAERIAQQRIAAAEQADFERAHTAWDERTRAARADRTRNQTIGFVTGGAGLTLVIAGGVLMANAAAAHDEAELARDRWLASPQEANQTAWRERLNDAQDERDLLQGLGLTALGVGAAGIAVGVGFLLAMPVVEQAPQAPGQPSRATGRLQLAPWLVPGGVGTRVRLRL